jgi:hypothetical protein
MIFLRAVLSAFLNPIVFFGYLLLATNRDGWGIEPVPDSVNVSRLLPGYYLAFAAAAFVLWLALVVAAQTSLLKCQTGAWPSPIAVLGAYLSSAVPGGRSYVAYLGFVGTALVLRIWISGMEGNIMGFFGAPILLGSIVCYLIGTYGTWGLHEAGYDFSLRFAPFQLVSSRGLWAQFLFLSFLSPYLYMVLVSPSDKAPAADSVALSVFVSIAGGLLFYGAWLVVNWGLLRLTGAGAAWGRTMAAYFASAARVRGFEHLALLILAAAALVALLLGTSKETVSKTAGAAIKILVLVQLFGAYQAFRETRAALSVTASPRR